MVFHDWLDARGRETEILSECFPAVHGKRARTLQCLHCVNISYVLPSHLLEGGGCLLITWEPLKLLSSFCFIQLASWLVVTRYILGSELKVYRFALTLQMR